MPDMWSDENVDDCESENRIPTGSTSAFMERMTVDVAKRQNEKQVSRQAAPPPGHWWLTVITANRSTSCGRQSRAATCSGSWAIRLVSLALTKWHSGI